MLNGEEQSYVYLSDLAEGKPVTKQEDAYRPKKTSRNMDVMSAGLQ